MTNEAERPAEGPAAEPGALTSLHVRRAAEGDAESLAWVVARLSPLLLAQAEYRLGQVLRSLYDPEDLVNDAWLVALPRLAELPPREGRHTPVLLRFLSTTLLHRINNLARKHLRGAAPERSAPRPQTGEPTDDPDPIDRFPADASGVVTRALRRERQAAVTTALEELEAADREILILRGIEQQTNRTVAAFLGLNPPAVAMRYHRALQKLRQRLPDSVYEEIAEE